MEQQLQNNEKNHVVRLFRSPTLETVKMVEETVKKYSGACKKMQIWERLPRKVMWSTYLVILNYLEEINKIITAGNGVLVHIWDSKGAKKYLSRKSY